MTSRAVERAIIDTSVYVENFRNGRFQSELLNLPFLVRSSAVVLAELWRGVRSAESKRFVAYLERNFPAVVPTESDWTESGLIVSRLALRETYQRRKLQEIHFDVLIALTARRIGAFLITCNRADFTAIQKVQEFKLICW